MLYFLTGAFLLGVVVSYFFLAMPARRAITTHQDHIKESQSLLEQAKKEREELKQQVADLEYKNKELEKDLEHGRKNS